MKLLELFDKTVNFKWQQKDADYASGTFNMGTMIYKVDVELQMGHTEEFWNVSFAARDRTHPEDEEAGKWKIDNTDTGRQFKVYSTVIAMLKQHMQQHGMHPIYMLAFDSGRMSLYTRMLKRLLPGWEIKAENDEIYASPAPTTDS